MAYTSDITYNRTETQEHPAERTRPWSQHRFFLSLFLIGTIIAVTGWLAEWMRLVEIVSFFRYSVMITLVGHVIQVIGAFGLLLTPDYVEEDN